jgi:pimeloyl-ACP methyl ester carboxylesterase
VPPSDGAIYVAANVRRITCAAVARFELEQVTIHGHEVGYRRGGEGPSLLLIHGMAGSSATWKEVMPLLAGGHDVIAPDLMGHGESAKPVGDYSLGAYASGLRDLLVLLEVPGVTVVGQSLGGGVAMQLAYQHPELVERLVLVGSGGFGRDVSWLLRSLTLPGAELLMPLLFARPVRDRGNEVSRFLHRRGMRAPHLAEMWRSYASLAEAENRHAFIRTLRSVVDPGGQIVNATDRLYLAAKKPTLVVWGARDPIIPVAHAHVAHEAIPGSHLVIFDDCGHFPHVEAPGRFSNAVINFIRSTEPGAAQADTYRELLLGASASAVA